MMVKERLGTLVIVKTDGNLSLEKSEVVKVLIKHFEDGIGTVKRSVAKKRRTNAKTIDDKRQQQGVREGEGGTGRKISLR